MWTLFLLKSQLGLPEPMESSNLSTVPTVIFRYIYAHFPLMRGHLPVVFGSFQPEYMSPGPVSAEVVSLVMLKRFLYGWTIFTTIWLSV